MTKREAEARRTVDRLEELLRSRRWPTGRPLDERERAAAERNLEAARRVLTYTDWTSGEPIERAWKEPDNGP